MSWGFHCKYCFFCDRNACTVLNTAFLIFSVVTKNRCHFRHRSFQKSQKYLHSGKNTKKNLLQLRCSNVLLHLKYKVLLCEPKIEFHNFAGGKALATHHRAHSEGQLNVLKHFLQISKDFRRFPKIADDFRRRTEDVSIIHQRI